MDTQTTTPTTSAAPPPAAVSTPTSGVTTTTTAAPTPAERPKTFAEAFAKDAAQHTAETSTQPEGATTPPVEATDDLSATPNPSTDKGPIPFEVHQKTLANARTKAVEEFRQTAGIDKAVEFANKINTNAPGFWREMTSELLAHPTHGAALRSDLARMFGGLRQPAAPKPVAAEPMPGPDVQIVDANGQVTGMTYSAEQLDKRDSWREKQTAEKAAKADRDRQTAQTRATETAKQVEAKSNEILADITDTLELDASTPKEQSDLLFREVNKLMAQNAGMSAHRAALLVRKSHVIPAKAGKAQADVLESLKTKAAAQAVNPAGAVVATTSRPKSFLDKTLKW